MGINNLYLQPGYVNSTSSSIEFDSDVVKAAMKRIYEKKYDTLTEIDEELFDQFWDIYNNATDKGFGVREETDADFDFYQELRYNNGVFAAFKTHRLQNDMAAQLLDENGKLKTFQQWEQDTVSIRDHHVRRWLETEYNTAVKRAHLAADWRQFEREKDVLPNLEWMPSTAVEPDEIHKKLWGTILPVDDPFWNEYRPGDRWGCKCSLRNTDKEIKRPPRAYKQLPKPAPGLDNNPGKDAMLYSFSHPYYTKGHSPYKVLSPVVSNFVNKQFNRLLKQRIKIIKETIHPFNGILIKNNNFFHNEMVVLRTSLNSINEHALTDKNVKLWLYSFNKIKIKKWEYIGWDFPKKYPSKHPKFDPKNPDKRKHPETEYFLYYKLNIAGKTYYANVKWHKDLNKEVLYTIEKKKPHPIRDGEPGEK